MSNALVSATHLAKSYGEHVVLRDVSLEVPAGTVTCIIGPSGSGKTTILRGLNALTLLDTGAVRIGDAELDYAALSPSSRGRLPREQRSAIEHLRAHSAMVFQSHNLFPHLTVLQNVIECPVTVQGESRAAATQRAHELLDHVGIEAQAEKYPAQLSGGQQQRVGIARALAQRPSVVLFDEPTSALDPELVGGVLGVMKDLAAEGLTMVVVTHELRFAQQVADQVLFIDGGLIVEQGPPDQVIGDPTQARTRTFLDRLLNPI